jgi:hypothetical protein
MPTPLYVSDLIRRAYLLAQVWDPGEEQPGVESNEGLLTLNMLINEWSQMGTFIPTYTTLNIPLVQAQVTQIITPPITDILEAHIIDASNFTYLLSEANLNQFNTFNFNQLQQRPSWIYLETPQTNIQTQSIVYFYPVPDTTYTATLYAKQLLPEFTYSQVITNVPLFYFKCLLYQLAFDLHIIYKTILADKFYEQHAELMANLKSTNQRDMSVRANNEFRDYYRRFRPWNIYVS